MYIQMLDVTHAYRSRLPLNSRHKTTYVMTIESLHIQPWCKQSEPQHSSQVPTTSRGSWACPPGNFELWMRG